jgi:hypothetical protein
MRSLSFVVGPVNRAAVVARNRWGAAPIRDDCAAELARLLRLPSAASSVYALGGMRSERMLWGFLGRVLDAIERDDQPPTLSEIGASRGLRR